MEEMNVKNLEKRGILSIRTVNEMSGRNLGIRDFIFRRD